MRVFLMVLEAGKSKIKAPADLELAFWCTDRPLLRPRMAESGDGRTSAHVSFIRA